MEKTNLPPGFRAISGKRNPSAGKSYYVILRNGMMPEEPWPAGRTASGQTRWIWKGDDDKFDIVAVKEVK